MASDDDLLAHDLATEAGRRLLDLRRRDGFGDPVALRATGDRLSHEFLVTALASHRPGDAVLSEEGADDRARLGAGRVWIVDPLDGTREFGEAGRTDWAVHVALWIRSRPADAAAALAPAGSPAPVQDTGGRLAAGAVALPAQGRTWSTGPAGARDTAARGAPGGAAARSGDEPGSGRLRLVVSRTRPPKFLGAVAAAAGADLVPLGSAGAKVISVVSGEADGYVHAGGQYEWDSAAPVAVAQAAGLHASRIDGSPLAYNQPDPRLPDILVCRPAIAGMLLEQIHAAMGTPREGASR